MKKFLKSCGGYYYGKLGEEIGVEDYCVGDGLLWHGHEDGRIKIGIVVKWGCGYYGIQGWGGENLNHPQKFTILKKVFTHKSINNNLLKDLGYEDLRVMSG